MKKSKMGRRIAVLLTAAVLAASLGVTAFAAGSDFTSGTYTTASTTFTFRKDIVVVNDGGAAYVYTPDVTYTYSVTPAEVGADTSVTDSAGNSLAVDEGVAGGVTLTDDEAVFTSTRTALTDGKAVVSNEVSGSVDLAQFPAAGIYRYVITETVDKAELTKQGISRDTATYQEKRYLDVYISNDDSEDNTTGLKVSGYVLFVADDGGAVIDRTDETADTIVGKTEGFVDTTELTAGGAGQAGLADTYYTYDLTVQVDILGSLADETHKFPISIATASRGGTARAFDYDVTVGGNTTPYTGSGAGIVQPGGQVGTAVSTELAKGDSITLYGLPADTSFNVTETNDSPDTYSITVKADGTTLTDKTSVSVDGGGTISAFDEKTAISNYVDYTTTDIKADYNTILFENTLNDVSLTGVVLRAAPYAILLAAAVLLGVFYLNGRKKKASKNVL